MNESVSNIKNNKKFELPKWLSFLKRGDSLFYYFLFLLFLGVCFLAISLFSQDFTTPFSGDYVSQQFAFYTNGYDDWWHFFKTGEFILYDENTFLGANNIASNSFYYLFDPFFLPILLVPREFIPQGMAILTILKLSLAGLAFYFYMRYMGASNSTAKITGIMYAFSGWVAWYLWFNHFSEVAVCFPLILLGIEKTLKEKNPILLGAGLLLLGLTNYFFLASLTICAFIYAMFRYFQRLKLNSTKDNILIICMGFVGFLSGLLMSMVIFLPSIVIAINSTRVTDVAYKDAFIEAIKNNNIIEALSYLFSYKDSSYRSLYPFIEFFYPPMTNRGTPLIVLGNESYDNVAGSIFCYSPSIILLIPALIDSFKNKKYSHIVAALLFLFSLVTPLCYALFHGFTELYSRWTIFVTTSLIAYSGLQLDKIKTMPTWHILLGGLFAIFGLILGATCSNIIVNNFSSFTYRLNIVVVMLIAICYVSLITAILLILRNKKYFEKVVLGFVSFEVILTGAFVIMGHGLTPYRSSNNGLENNIALQEVVKQTNKKDKSYYRSISSLADDQAKNDGMRSGYNGVSTYHSVYNYNLINFLDWTKLTNTGRNGWSVSYLSKSFGLDNILGIKYRYILKDYLRNSELGNYQNNVPFGYVDISNEYESDKYLIYKNLNHIPFAFTYDSITSFNSENNELGNIATNNTFTELYAEEKMLNTALLDYKDVKEISNRNVDFTVSDISNDSYKTLNNSSKYFDVITYRRSENKTNKLNSVDEIIKASNSPIISKPNDNSNLDLILTIENEAFISMYDEKGMVIYLSIPYKSNHKVDVYLFDEDENLITYDRHNDDRETRSNSRKKLRAFYINSSLDDNGNFVPAPKLKKIVIIPRFTELYSDYPLAISNYSKIFNNSYNELLNYQVENVINKTNKYYFTTNFATKRFIVTQLAYEKGFKVKALCSCGEVKYLDTYIANGGFLGFESLANEAHYEISFEPPYLKTGIILTSVGLITYLTSLGIYYYLSYKNKKKELNSL